MKSTKIRGEIMENIRFKYFIDVDEIVNKWNRESETDDMWELVYYPIRDDFLVITFERDLLEHNVFEYRFLIYDLKARCMLDKIFEIELESKKCCTVLEVREDSLLLDIWDCSENDVNYICDSKNMERVIEYGFGSSCCTPILGSNKIAVGFGYEAIKEKGGGAIKIYCKDNGELVYEYVNEKALGCIDMYSDKVGAVWASFWGENKIVKIEENQSVAYECEMSGFDAILMVDTVNNYIYVNFSYDCCKDRIFKMEYLDGRYVNATEVLVSIPNENGEEEIIDIGSVSSGHGYALAKIRDNVVGVLDI